MKSCADDAAGAIADAKDVGASYLGTAWIPHQGAFTRAHVDQAVADFTKWGKALKAEGCSFTTTSTATSSSRAPTGRSSTR